MRAWLLLLAAAATARACGPGRGGGSRRMAHKITPLVIHQSDPNVEEHHSSASGPPEGRITQGDPRFRDLVPNYNLNIDFKDEEGTGADRLMTQRCKEKLDTLAISVMNQWPKVKLMVLDGWEEDEHHFPRGNYGDLHYEGRAVDITTSDRDRSKYGMLARLAVDAGFDWVHYESKKHIHCSVKSESSETPPSGGCFPAASVVRIEGGRTTTISELRPGDRVQAWDQSTGKMIYSEVLTFLDRDADQVRRFVRVHLAGNASVTATEAHLLLLASGAPVWAGAVRPGDQLLTPAGGARVLRVQRLWLRGVYAPLTSAGTLRVDGALVSCYAAVRSARLAHLALAPLRAWLSLVPAPAPAPAPAPTLHAHLAPGVHPYVRALYALGRLLLPASMFYHPPA